MSTSPDDSDAAVVNCPNCGDTSGPTDVCPVCQPHPEIKRCVICARRGPRPAEDQTGPDSPPSAGQPVDLDRSTRPTSSGGSVEPVRNRTPEAQNARDVA